MIGETFKTTRFQLVELVIGAAISGNNSDIYFQNQPQLQSISGGRQIFIEAIETYANTDLAVSPITSGNPVANAAAIANATLTLSVDTNLSFKQIPLVTLHRAQSETGGVTAPFTRQLFRLNEIWQVDWTKSYITCSAAPVGAPFSYLLGVHYRYSTDQEAVSLGDLYSRQMQLESQLSNLSQRLAVNRL